MIWFIKHIIQFSKLVLLLLSHCKYDCENHIKHSFSKALFKLMLSDDGQQAFIAHFVILIFP
jgi:hypothetical protein